ncbi:carbamoyltransferase HypF [soil metagenome]
MTGTVQGVGFRPFVYREAAALGLSGVVGNDARGVLIEAQGPSAALQELARRVRDQPPPLARVVDVRVEALDLEAGAVGFVITASRSGGPATSPVGVDTAACAACLAEVDDPDDRRHRYPFTNCTDCGPRYTIVRSVPYDRPATTMAGFTMCATCQREYDDPGDRRFHAQPNACPTCGPQLTWRRPDGAARAEGESALDAAAAALRSGAVVAVKGVGGYHLAVDAGDAAAVADLRRRKARDDKPFAVMAVDLVGARALGHLDAAAEAALPDPRRPIVLVPRRADAPVAEGVAPGLPELGLLLPYSPLHHLLLGEVGRPLVMTSGNRSDEPIAHDDDDAVARLGPLVDGLLTHDRPIHIRCDDSVGRSTATGVRLLRRSRGFAPEPLSLPRRAPRPVLAVGAELKSTVAVAWDDTVVASHHIGDLEHLAAHRSFLQAIDHLLGLYDVVPEVVAHDLHPEYLSTKLALDLDLPLLGVQHHHAHVASCLVEHVRTEPVLGLAFDGTGYGSDGTLWGGEYLVADLQTSRRVGHLRTLPLPGGAAAIREPWRVAAAWRHAAGLAPEPPPSVDPGLADGVGRLVAAGQGPTTSSMGRLFDALGSLVTGRVRATYEAQAAIELEALARSVERSGTPGPGSGEARPAERAGAWSGTTDVRWEGAAEGGDPAPDAAVGPAALSSGPRREEVAVLDPGALVGRVVEEMAAGSAPSEVAARAHQALGDGVAALAVELAGRHGLGTVVLTGGVFQNAVLSQIVGDALRASGLEVLEHHRVPCNDGGISIGQAAIAAAST